MQSAAHLEKELLTALAAGDRAATEHIYKKNFHIICNWLQKNGGSPSDAADLFQEGMLVLFGRAQNKDFKLTCCIGTYLFEVSKHLWFKKVKKQRRQPVYLIDNLGKKEIGVTYPHNDEINLHKERELHFEQLGMALNQLGEPCKSLLKAYYYRDDNMQKIAADFGYSNQETAKNQKYKCLGRLRKLFYSIMAE